MPGYHNATEAGLNIKKSIVPVFLVCVFLLSVIQIEDTDTWTHLSLGRLITHIKELPSKEPFIFPSLEKPFHDPEWLFDILFYSAYALAGIIGVILLKALIITAVFYILYKDSLVPYKNHMVSIAVLVFIVFMTRHRFVERPDIVLMLFLSFSVFSLNAFICDNRKYIYFLPLTHMLWANMHPSVVIMPVPFIAFLGGGIVQNLIRKKYGRMFPDTPSAGQLRTILFILFLSFLASLINPYLADQYIFPFKLANMDWWRDEIMELQPPNWEGFKSPYLLAAALGLSFLVNIRGFSIINLFLILPFAYLSFTALRFIFLLGIIGGPVIVKNIGSVDFTLRHRKFIDASLVILVTVLTALTLFGAGPFYSPVKRFGFGINYDFFPEGALRYLDKRDIEGKVFNTFEWGGYITWRDFPRRAPFIDGRGLLSYDLLNKLDLMRTRNSVLDDLQKRYGFDVAVINYPETPYSSVNADAPDVDIALSSRDWVLVYWDDLSLVYLKKEDKYKNIIEQDSYRFIRPANGPYAIKIYDKEYLSGLISELKRNIRETGSSLGYAFLGFVYNEAGLYKEAIESLSMVKDISIGSNIFNAYQGLAYAKGKLGDYEGAVRYYKKALGVKNEASVLYNLGIIYIRMGNEKKAASYLEEALSMNSNLLSIYPKLIEMYQKAGDQKKLSKAVEMYEMARTFNSGEEHFKKAVKAYLEQQFEIAADEYKKSIEANPSNPSAYSNLGYIYYDLGMIDQAYEYQKMAVDIDPEFANAHYGLALIYRKLGNKENARYEWQEYLRIEPKGYFSRKAKEELGKL